MPDIDPLVWAGAAVVAVIAVLAVLHFRFQVFRRRKARGRPKSGILSHPRVEVLETTIIDEERKLVLVRCDKIEHLIMVGGPADVVVENDVKKVRGPGEPPAKLPIPEPTAARPTVAQQRPPHADSEETAVPPPPAPKVPESSRSAPRPAGAQLPQRMPVAAIHPAPSRPSGRNVETQTGGTGKTDDRGHGPRPQPADAQASRRDGASPRRAPLMQPSLMQASRSTETPHRQPAAQGGDWSARPARGNRADEAPGLPAAQIPWSDPDSIENEIVRALRFDPQTRGGEQAHGRREAPMPKTAMDSSTTLGDLADRLEEALAREMQSTTTPLRRTEPDTDAFGFDAEPVRVEAERPKPAPRDRPEKRAESARGGAAPAAEPERREVPPPAERREEAPVISLNSRRREAVDPLEDEMARLLGELTGDTKGR